LQHLRLFPGSPVFGTVGSLVPCKGHSFLIDAMPPVLRTLPRAQFVFVGDGPLRARLEAQTRLYGVEAQVEFLGERSDALQLLSSFDCLVHPSLAEGMPNAVLEAMAAGLPVIVTGVGGVPEIVDDGLTGLIVPPRSSEALAARMIRVGSDEALRARLGTAAREAMATGFSVRREAEETLSVYHSLLRAREKAHRRRGHA
jgi:glycosyltransferase involved in cell wall biosynthesis